jgi:tRNA nucleotidyltransferase (CCA-adding enzyme)
MMPRPQHAYPQVEPGAAGVINVAVAATPPRSTVRRALDVARRRDAGLVTVGTRHVLRSDLARAAELDLLDLDAASLARPLPVVEARASEVAVRRKLMTGAPLVVVRRGGRIIGAVERTAGLADQLIASVRVAAALGPEITAMLSTIGQLAAARGARAFAVGGLVRDALLGRAPTRDLDVVVDGDGPGVARDLAARRGSSLVQHPTFLTASVAAGAPSDPVGRVDIATARVERYDPGGALPRVKPAHILDDLRRRDFSVNAMALELDSGRFALLDPVGGRSDLSARRLRVLHPLSFVEDPTRMFRAARYAARLGLSMDAWTLRAQRLALSLAPYPRLSGQRLLTEVERIVSEPTAGEALTRLGAAGVFRLLDPRYRFTRGTARRVCALHATLTWCEDHAVAVRPVELAVAATLADQPATVTAAVGRRLALAGEPLARLNAALAVDVHALAPLRSRVPSTRAAALRPHSALGLAWLRLIGDDAVRAVLDWYVDEGRGVATSLRGDDVIALGVPRGPEVARTLARLREARLDGVVRDGEGERAYVRTLLAEASDGGGERGSGGAHIRGEG